MAAASAAGQGLCAVYDLDNLDTRLTTPSSVPYPADGRPAPRKPDPKAKPSKWRTPEFYFYYVIFIVTVPYMFWIVYSVSRPSDPRYVKYEHLLSPGWVPGRKIDVTDAQYHTFRSNLPYTVTLLVVHPLLRRAWNAFVRPLPSSKFSSESTDGKHVAAASNNGRDAGDARLDQRASFDFLFALVFLAALHGFSALKVLLILAVNYRIGTGRWVKRREWVPLATWIFNICILFANELARGYRFRDMAVLISPGAGGVAADEDSWLVAWGAWLDKHGGLVDRWEILFNITVLRLISFNMDCYWSLAYWSAGGQGSASPVEPQDRPSNLLKKKQLDATALSERDRVSIPAAPSAFTFRNYVAYTLYAPLYLAGPILTFNDYISQSRYGPVSSIQPGRTLAYGIRFLLALLAAELTLHICYVGAISHSSPVWSSYTPAQLSMLSYFNLHIIWLKLLLPWRLFRLWSLLDGIDPPENMVRCVSDNFSTLAFWRAWHRSYNRWLVRYVWVPLGGSRHGFATPLAAARSVGVYVLVFTFVALWHDIQLRLLLWGWLIVLFMLPEMAARWAFPARKWQGRETAYRMLCCLGGVGNVLMMMAANLVGFAVGLDGLQTILEGIFAGWEGLVFLVTACAALFVGIQVMFEIREDELRRGISLKC